MIEITSDTFKIINIDDIIIQDGRTYDSSKYIKIAHIYGAEIISSIIIQDETYPNDFLIKSQIDAHSISEGYNFAKDVLVKRNLLSNGIMEYYSNRSVFFFKIQKTGVAQDISIDSGGILQYAWYSDVPDYYTGSNCISRTSENTPPENAKYCGVLLSGTSFNSIQVSRSEESSVSKSIEYSFINNSIGETLFQNGLISNLKILGFGNSFMRNSVYYLSKIANGLGVNLTVGNLYVGGVNLSTHLQYLKNDTANYSYYKDKDGLSVNSENGKTAKYGLLDESWDAIILHQYQPTSVMPNYEPFEPYLSNIIKEIVKVLGYTPKFYINATWAGSLDSNSTYYGYETEQDMWNGVLSANIQASEDSGIINIIPTGTAIQNARTLSFADEYGRFVNIQGNDYHHLNPAGGFIAACTIYEKIIYPLNNKHCSETSFRITEDTALPPQTTTEPGILVTDENYNLLCQSAIEAVLNMSEIKQIS